MTTTDELVERLQNMARAEKLCDYSASKLYTEAATALLAKEAEIERLTKERELHEIHVITSLADLKRELAAMKEKHDG